MGDQPGVRRPQSASGARRRPRSPRRAAGRPGPDARGHVAADRRRRAGGARSAGGLRPGRVAENVRVAGLSHLCPHRPALAVPARCGWPPRPSRGRSSGGCPNAATSRWWKEEREGVFVDFNQNAKDRTVASAYSVRATPDARVSTPLHWDEVADCTPEAFTIATVPGRFAEIGDPWAGMERRGRRARPAADAGRRTGPAGARAERREKRRKRAPTADASHRSRSSKSPAPRPRTRRWPRWTPGAAATPPSPGGCSRPMSWSTACAGRVRSGTASGSTCSTSPVDQRPPQEELIADYSPWEGYTPPASRRGAEPAGELPHAGD